MTLDEMNHKMLHQILENQRFFLLITSLKSNYGSLSEQRAGFLEEKTASLVKEIQEV